MNDIKLLVLDMDGTSYYKMGTIVEENIEPLKQVMEQGVHLAFVTGRPALAKFNNIEGHGLVKDHSIMGACNGACIYDLKNKKVLASNPIDSETAKQVFELAKKPEFAGTVIWGYVDNLNDVVVNATDEIGDGEIYNQENQFFHGDYIQYEEVKENFEFKFFKLLTLNAKPGFIQELRETTNLNIASNDEIIGEINAPGINKKFAINWFSKYLNVPVENIMAVGDGMNDLDMIKHAGVGVAMKNSVQPIKDAADVYIDINSDDAAVKAIVEKYILK
ncbi:Cof-type HAD-IIB family hydrolase [[Acholeplasma] multilocale]|uniref:Cof-type HAD-IIB family hydrolase n=1 Tax=[Acholeplasma] multilocale TaxID=264638 RepID=UPI0004786BD0|nr:Cof-type HAD-IIB family hydrolase [[Acholeplasma] multilocale]